MERKRSHISHQERELQLCTFRPTVNSVRNSSVRSKWSAPTSARSIRSAQGGPEQPLREVKDEFNDLLQTHEALLRQAIFSPRREVPKPIVVDTSSASRDYKYTAMTRRTIITREAQARSASSERKGAPREDQPRVNSSERRGYVATPSAMGMRSPPNRTKSAERSDVTRARPAASTPERSRSDSDSEAKANSTAKQSNGEAIDLYCDTDGNYYMDESTLRHFEAATPTGPPILAATERNDTARGSEELECDRERKFRLHSISPMPTNVIEGLASASDWRKVESNYCESDGEEELRVVVDHQFQKVAEITQYMESPQRAKARSSSVGRRLKSRSVSPKSSHIRAERSSSTPLRKKQDEAPAPASPTPRLHRTDHPDISYISALMPRKRSAVATPSGAIAHTFAPSLNLKSVELTKGESFGDRQRRYQGVAKRNAEVLRQAAGKECVFAPTISELAKKQTPRSNAERHADAAARQARLRALKQQAEQAAPLPPFKPQINHESILQQFNVGANSMLSLTRSTAVHTRKEYIDRVKHDEQTEAARKGKLAKQREELEQRMCTFQPKINDLPHFIQRMSRRNST